MIEGLPLVPLGQTALLSVFVLLVFFGRLIPRRTYDDMIADRDAWRSTTEKQTEQLEKLLTHAETTNAILRDLPHPSDRVVP